MLFEGEYLNGTKWNGEIKSLYFKSTYKGSIKNGLKNGQGQEFNERGYVIYNGGW